MNTVVAKLTTLALASAAALTGKKEKRSYALVNDTWSLLVTTLVAIGRTISCSAGAGKLLAELRSQGDNLKSYHTYPGRLMSRLFKQLLAPESSALPFAQIGACRLASKPC